MALYLKAGVDVVIGPQTECGPDVPPIAIAVAADQAFWIDCCDTVELAHAHAEALGLRVVGNIRMGQQCLSPNSAGSPGVLHIKE